jgi:hypothetical protein
MTFEYDRRGDRRKRHLLTQKLEISVAFDTCDAEKIRDREHRNFVIHGDDERTLHFRSNIDQRTFFRRSNRKHRFNKPPHQMAACGVRGRAASRSTPGNPEGNPGQSRGILGP